MSKDKETKGISAVMIIEVMGTPPEHLNETLEIIIKKIDEEKGVSVITKKINEPIGRSVSPISSGSSAAAR